MSHTIAELNNIAQECANRLGHIEQNLLLEIHALLHPEAKAVEAVEAAVPAEAVKVEAEIVAPVATETPAA